MVWTETYNAWCRNLGNHETSAQDRVNWNAKIISKMCSELERAWINVLAEAPIFFAELATSLSNDIAKLRLGAVMSQCVVWR